MDLTGISDSFLFLTGFMGAGKSYWGSALANQFGVPFTDLDGEVEQLAGLSIFDIFENEGESYFRVLESQALKQIVKSKVKPSIIALGGGTLMNSLNQEQIKNKGPLICLQNPSSNVSWRGSLKRPLLKSKARATLFEERIGGYSISNACIRVDLLSREQTLRQLIKLWICHGKAR